MKSSNAHQPKFRQDLRRAFGRKDGHGIKAVIGCSTLWSLICAGKKQCALCRVQLDAVTQGEHFQCAKCKLRHALETAEAVFKKYDRRNKLAFEERERKRGEEARREEREGSLEGELHGEEPTEFRPLGNALKDALKDALEAARPTRW